MRLICPNCGAKYEVPSDAIPQQGRDVQCSACAHAWFQMPEGIQTLPQEDAGLTKVNEDLAPHDAPLSDASAPPPHAAPPATAPEPEAEAAQIHAPNAFEHASLNESYEGSTVRDEPAQAAVAESATYSSPIAPPMVTQSAVMDEDEALLAALSWDEPPPLGASAGPITPVEPAVQVAVTSHTEDSIATDDTQIVTPALTPSTLDITPEAPALTAETAAPAANTDPVAPQPDLAVPKAAENDAEDTEQPVAIPRPELDEGVLAILREEANFEAEARRLDAQRKAELQRSSAEADLRSQPDLGIDHAPMLEAQLSERERRLEALRGADLSSDAEEEEKGAQDDTAAAMAEPFADDQSADIAPVPTPEDHGARVMPSRPARRDLLPDVEALTSTLESNPNSPNTSNTVAQAHAQKAKSRSSFRSGFVLSVVVLAGAAGVYAAADPISKTIPSLKAPLASYTNGIDGMRARLTTAMTDFTKSLGTP